MSVRDHVGWTALCLALLAVGGCVLTEQPVEPVAVATPNDTPETGLNGRFIAAVGASDSGDAPAAFPRAEKEARAEFVRQIGAHARSSMAMFLRAHADYVDPESRTARDYVDAVGAQVAGAVMRQTPRCEGWHDIEADVPYVMYRVPIRIVNERIREAAEQLLGDIAPFAQAREAEAMVDLAAFLEADLQRRVAEAAKTRPPERNGVPESSPPQWLFLGRHPNYPDDEFLLAVGIGDDATSAAANAEQQLAARLAGAVRGRVNYLVETRPESPVARDALGAGLDEIRLVELPAPSAQYPEHWYDRQADTYYVLALWRRSLAGEMCAKAAAEAAQAAQELVTSAANHARADNTVTALRTYARARTQALRAVRFELAAVALDPKRAVDENRETLRDVAEAGLTDICAGIKLTPSGGSGQWTPPGVPLREPLAVSVAAGPRAVPVAAFPLRFEFADGAGTLEETVYTDQAGLALCHVASVLQTRSAHGTIRCRPALEVVYEDLPDMPAARVPEATFTYVVRARTNTVLVLWLEEMTVGGTPAVETVVRDALDEVLTDGDYRTAQAAQVAEVARARGLTSETPQADLAAAFAPLVREAAPGAFSLVLAGRTRCELVEKIETSVGDVFIVQAQAEVSLLDVARQNDPVIFRVEAGGRAVYAKDMMRAARDARLKAARTLAAKLRAELNARFGRP